MTKKASKLRALSALIGTTIGAGIFALPYVLHNIGFFTFAGLLILVGLLTTFVNQIYVSVINGTQGDHQLSGYAAIYLGRVGEFIAFFSLTLGLYGALTAYLGQAGEFLAFIFPVEQQVAALVFWIVFSLPLLFGLHLASWGGIVLSFGIILLIVALSIFSFFQISDPVSAFVSLVKINSTSLREFISLTGVVMFAFGGTSVIPEVEEILREESEKLLSVVRLSSIVVTVLYLLFSAVVVVISGQQTTVAALEGLAATLGGTVMVIAPLLGVLALGSSFLLLSYSLREIFFRDFEVAIPISWFLALVPPLGIQLLSDLGFISILSFAGTVGIGISWFLVLFIYYRFRERA